MSLWAYQQQMTVRHVFYRDKIHLQYPIPPIDLYPATACIFSYSQSRIM